MHFSSAKQALLSKLSEWWRDREDERLDELFALDYRHLSSTAAETGVTPYELVSSDIGAGRNK